MEQSRNIEIPKGMSSGHFFQGHWCDVFKCTMRGLWCTHTLSLVLCVLALTPTTLEAGPETLCGAELVDTLQFVCGDRGFYFRQEWAPSEEQERDTGEEKEWGSDN
ncbi:hypothetical protein DNTS_020210 [Danionella cerebrum]|uniref:Insulin-like domain-containing protein n=1 Tax=Danionella cerebrum TaxID=2873325 RepID=A0A553NA15_9TELE|nr:hypothetical protein DNTS_020210 [Danionella translucida]